MKRNTFFVFTLLISLSAAAQEVVSTQGESYSNATGSLDFTVGEVVINTATDGNNTLTQGFHQTNWKFLGLDDDAPEVQVTIFPNPTSEILNIKTSSYVNATYTLYDALGKSVLADQLSDEQTPIQVGQLAAGAYTLELNFDNSDKSSPKQKTFKLIKTQ